VPYHLATHQYQGRRHADASYRPERMREPADTFKVHCHGLSVDRPYGAGMTTDSALALPDGRHDFDFLHGHWHSRQRKLRKRLVGCEDWDEFTADLHCRPVLGGLGNFDELASPAMTYTGLALRLYDEATRTWSIYWIAGGVASFDPPVVGHFADGVGDFLCPDTQEGRPVLVRYRWSDITATTARWAQAFSTDDGATWETNWTADFTRAATSGD
jgi:hypothetical protein